MKKNLQEQVSRIKNMMKLINEDTINDKRDIHNINSNRQINGIEDFKLIRKIFNELNDVYGIKRLELWIDDNIHEIQFLDEDGLTLEKNSQYISYDAILKNIEKNKSDDAPLYLKKSYCIYMETNKYPNPDYNENITNRYEDGDAWYKNYTNSITYCGD
jgi:hypothetical protein